MASLFRNSQPETVRDARLLLQKIQQKIMQPLEVKFVQPQTYVLNRDLKVMGGASPNQIKPLNVIPDGRLKRFFFGLLQT